MKKYQKFMSAVTVLSMCASYLTAFPANAASVKGGKVAVSIDQIELTKDQIKALDYKIPVFISLDRNPGLDEISYGFEISEGCTCEVITKTSEALPYVQGEYAKILGLSESDADFIIEASSASKDQLSWFAWFYWDILTDTGNMALAVINIPQDFSGGRVENGYRYYDVTYREESAADDILHEYNNTDDDIEYANSVEYTSGWIRIKDTEEEVTPSTGTLGDVNSDGNVNSSDAALLMSNAAQYAVQGSSNFSEAQEKNADVNQDGKFNSADAAIILNYAAAIGAGDSTTLEKCAASMHLYQKGTVSDAGCTIMIDDVIVNSNGTVELENGDVIALQSEGDNYLVPVPVRIKGAFSVAEFGFEIDANAAGYDLASRSDDIYGLLTETNSGVTMSGTSTYAKNGRVWVSWANSSDKTPYNEIIALPIVKIPKNTKDGTVFSVNYLEKTAYAENVFGSFGYTSDFAYESGGIVFLSEDSPEQPTEPSTEPPTEPSVPSSRENKFFDGGDNWSFVNSRTIFGKNYFLKDSDYKTLLNGLQNTEKTTIYDAVRNRSWNGSCYGMALTSILASGGILNPANYQSGAEFIHDISSPPADDVKSLINYYFMLQFTDRIQNETKQSAFLTEEEKLRKLISCLEDGSPVLLTYFGDFYGDKMNHGGHAVVAYALESGTYSKDGKVYNRMVKVYDNASGDYNENYCLYFNTNDWAWTIPYYQLNSAAGSTLGFISDDLNLLNMHGLLSGTKNAATSGEYIALLDVSALQADYSLYKVNYSDGKWIGAPTADDDIKPMASFSDDASQGSNLQFALRDTETGYSMKLDAPEKIDFSMNYENSRMHVNASSGKIIRFLPTDCISMEGKQTTYDMEIILNQNALVTDWYSFAVKGGKTDEVKLEKTKGGYILTSSDMKNVIAEAYNDNDDAFVYFSTDAESVYLYEIDKNTIGVKVDSNGDGTYDKLIAQTAEAKNGDANLDGTVDILDVITINKAVLGKETLTRHQNEFSDVNQNGVPDSSDSLAVLKYIVGLTTTL